jgi:hypothetical protein
MKISDLIFRYPTGSILKRDGICRVRIFVNSNNQVISLLTDLGGKNTSSSVTNSVERICTSLSQKGFVPKNTIFIEHYAMHTISYD